MRALIAAFLIASLTVATGPAWAQPATIAPAAPATPPTRTVRYGWKIILVDLAAVATAFVGVQVFLSQIDDDGGGEGVPSHGSTGQLLWMAAGATYLLGGPIIHHLHGNSSGTGQSFALRAGLPLVGALVGGLGDEAGAGVGVASLGIVTAIIVDATLLADHEVPGVGRVTPVAAPVAGGGLTLGVAGAF